MSTISRVTIDDHAGYVLPADAECAGPPPEQLQAAQEDHHACSCPWLCLAHCVQLAASASRLLAADAALMCASAVQSAQPLQRPAQQHTGKLKKEKKRYKREQQKKMSKRSRRGGEWRRQQKYIIVSRNASLQIVMSHKVQEKKRKKKGEGGSRGGRRLYSIVDMVMPVCMFPCVPGLQKSASLLVLMASSSASYIVSPFCHMQHLLQLQGPDSILIA